ncbi:MAG: lipoprotein-releasing ABC transporter permease subunit [Magnetococcales bacterium]|nr:lipoprotein-releasing ABC transporter permease subunit [Magnetococcales bacterium]MBF0114561.1 lipoprotein-releasing ABC transporter permease subunit [Magnetococcales bacterium]
MFSNRYEWLIGLRYLRAKRTQHFISVITFLSMGGIALGVAALIVVLAVMTGFRETLQQQILGVTSHVTVRSYTGEVQFYPTVLDIVSKTPGVAGASPFIATQAMIQSRGRALGISLRGIDNQREREVSDLEKNLTRGSLTQLNNFGIILGKNLATNLGVTLGDSVTVMVAAGNVTAMGTMPRMKRFNVVGTFSSGMYEYDSSLAYIHLPDAQALLRMNQTVTGIEIKTPDPELALSMHKTLEQRLAHLDHAQGGFWIQNWMDMNHNFFRALKLEKATMFVILFLVVVVAAFNIVSSLIMSVMEKSHEIAILKTMGATARGVMTIFIINGGIVGVLGTLSGLLLGLALALHLEAALGFIERLFGIQILAGDVYYIDHLPSKVVVSDVVWITGVSLAISLLATLYPAWRAARVDPIEALRYE